MKSGRLTNEEIDFIRANHTRMTYVEMATKLDRRVEPIRLYVEKKLGKNLITAEDRAERAEYDITRRTYWNDLKKQFADDELVMFVFHWKRIISQFKDDVFPTEEVQVVDAIKLEILMNRLLTQQQNNMNSIANFESLLKDEKDKDVDDRDMDLILRLEEQIATLVGAQESISREYRELLKEKNKLLSELKATRQQRIKRLDEKGASFIMWLTEIMNNTELRRSLGVRMEKMRKAMEQEKVRLSEYHKYEDGEVDIPFLNHETARE